MGEVCIKESKEQSPLAITLDQSFSFTTHLKTVCGKESQKLHAFTRVSCYIDTRKLKQLMRAFILSHLTIVHLFGCSVTELGNIKLILSMKGRYTMLTKTAKTILVSSWGNLI